MFDFFPETFAVESQNLDEALSQKVQCLGVNLVTKDLNDRL